MIAPASTHTHTLILLHGRGSNAENFGLEFLKSEISGGKALTDLFPGLKFIFPTAKKRRSTILKRVPINQWFDNYSLEDPSERQDLQYDGLSETTAYIHNLMRQEEELIGAKNVIVGGLSQGCAMAFHVLLSYEPEPDLESSSNAIGGFIGMSGWLPFQKDILSTVSHKDLGYSDDDDDSDDPFSTAQQDDDETELFRAANCVRDIVNLPPLSADESAGPPAFVHCPVFLGHGDADPKVSVRLGEEARDTLESLGINTTWRAYEGFGHWYKVPDEIDDIVLFLQREVGLKAKV